MKNHDWTTRKIRELGRVVTGKTPSTKDHENFGGPFPFITIPDLDGRVIIDRTARTLSEKGAGRVKSSLLPAGAVLMSCIATVGKCGVTCKPSFTNQQINSVIPNAEINSMFLYYVFTQLAHNLDSAGGGGSVYTNVSKSRFSDIEVPVPSLPEQRAIAAVLDSIVGAIERTGAVIATTQLLRDSLLHELLTHGVPGWHSDWKDVLGVGTIPACWEVVRLGEGVTHVGSGVTPRGGRSVYTASGIPFLRSQNIHFDGLSLEDVVFIPSEIDDSMHRSRVQPGDVLLNITGASIGRCTIVPTDLGPANVNQHVCIIRTTEGFNPLFVWKWLSTPRSQREIDEIQTGQSRQGLNYQQVRQLTIARPPRTEQDSIVEIMSRIDATLEAVRQERDRLQSLQAAAAAALLTGRVRVSSRTDKH